MAECSYNIDPKDRGLENPCGEPAVVNLWKITQAEDEPPYATLCQHHWNMVHARLESAGPQNNWLGQYHWEDIT